MGIAAYNRGTKALREMIDRQQRPREFVLMDELTKYSAERAQKTVFAPTVIRQDQTGFYLMNRPDKGWAEFSYMFDSIWAVAREWRLVFTGLGRDQYSTIWTVSPAPAKEGL
jgi:hypothetical protein